MNVTLQSTLFDDVDWATTTALTKTANLSNV